MPTAPAIAPVITPEREAHDANRAYDYLISVGFTPEKARENLDHLFKHHMHTTACTADGYNSCY